MNNIIEFVMKYKIFLYQDPKLKIFGHFVKVL